METGGTVGDWRWEQEAMPAGVEERSLGMKEGKRGGFRLEKGGEKGAERDGSLLARWEAKEREEGSDALAAEERERESGEGEGGGAGRVRPFPSFVAVGPRAERRPRAQVDLGLGRAGPRGATEAARQAAGRS